MVQLPLTTLGQETRWAYSTTLPSPHGARRRRVEARLLGLGDGRGLGLGWRKGRAQGGQVSETVISVLAANIRGGEGQLPYIPSCRVGAINISGGGGHEAN